MITEIAQIDVKPGSEKDFEAAIAKAEPIFRRCKGWKSFELHRSIEKPSALPAAYQMGDAGKSHGGFSRLGEFRRMAGAGRAAFRQPAGGRAYRYGGEVLDIVVPANGSGYCRPDDRLRRRPITTVLAAYQRLSQRLIPIANPGRWVPAFAGSTVSIFQDEGVPSSSCRKLITTFTTAISGSASARPQMPNTTPSRIWTANSVAGGISSAWRCSIGVRM